ncbi:hypothetical protein H0I39_15470 [Ottowia beijingensis]|uniref:Uncharacterized protein n=1 Tax=Ottowia beijingensis TaxID=1207057 RepID=A0A853IYR9_9BURK|nr:hypothetical protein [Ottowia beijingensis]NZA02789.1 hypothetical protein [Ottowia beijingensis]
MGLALGLAAAPAGAQAAVITFDDLTCSAWGTLIPNGYAGLNWSNFDCIDGATAWDGNSGYNAGRVSGSHVAYNGAVSPPNSPSPPPAAPSSTSIACTSRARGTTT